MNTSKPKLQIAGGKPSKVTLGASASSKLTPTALTPKKDYKKNKGLSGQDFGSPGFGDTGMTGES
jgi:hypothetical protein